MKLLIATQAVDIHDPVLGFFHEWLVAFSAKFDAIEVICLREGKHALPENVRVHSLGKEAGGGKMTYALRFLSHIWKLRSSYDAVLVHMNPEYVILGGVWWKLWKKKMYLWYNHPKGGVRLWLAMLFADVVFYTSPYAASAHTRKSVRMPAGVDTELFQYRGEVRRPHSLYLQGRVARSKRVEIALEAVRLLRERNIPATLTIVGPEDGAYVRRLRSEYADLISEGSVTFLGPKTNRETPALYASHAVALNLAGDGHYDKTVLEAMACETPVIVASNSFHGLVPDVWSGKATPEKLANALGMFFALSIPERTVLGKEEHDIVAARESLTLLGESITQAVCKVTVN